MYRASGLSRQYNQKKKKNKEQGFERLYHKTPPSISIHDIKPKDGGGPMYPHYHNHHTPTPTQRRPAGPADDLNKKMRVLG